MTSQEIRKKFIDYFRSNGHQIAPSSSLLPDDKSVLLTTAGMQQFKDYYTGAADPLNNIHPTLGKALGNKNVSTAQKCFRTSDIDEVGDVSHLTFFEMLGNFSFGGYFKKEAITLAFNFFKELNLPIDFVTVFSGDSEVPADDESAEIWKGLGVAKIEKRGREDNFWGPTGNEGPCGPTTEIYVNGIEIWNIVFNEYYFNPDKSLTPLKIKGVDTGMGLERLVMVLQNKNNIFETDLFAPFISILPSDMEIRIKRIMVDHIRAVSFLISDGVRPSNKEAGYILRRLMRRAIVYEHLARKGSSFVEFDVLELGEEKEIKNLFDKIIEFYKDFYPELNKEIILSEFDKENGKFRETLRSGLRELKKISSVDAKSAFKLYETFGLPYDIIKELSGEKASGLTREEFDEEFKKHQEVSRAGQVKKFGGHGLTSGGSSEKTESPEDLQKITRLHTATHILHQALRIVLGNQVQQMGSDINAERLRFDFVYPEKLTEEEKIKVSDIVNHQIEADTSVEMKEMAYEEAIKSGALAFFKEKYPVVVKVYSVGDFSKEICGGPHVSHTGEIGRFKIIKEESSSAGVRRIRAIIE